MIFLEKPLSAFFLIRADLLVLAEDPGKIKTISDGQKDCRRGKR